MFYSKGHVPTLTDEKYVTDKMSIIINELNYFYGGRENNQILIIKDV